MEENKKNATIFGSNGILFACFMIYSYICTINIRKNKDDCQSDTETEKTMAEILDETDLQILKTLQRNAKLTTKELAEAVHLTPTPVFERQKRLERQGYIRKYVAIIDPEKMGLGLLVFCKVKLQQINHEKADAFVRRIMRIPEVTECYNTSGAYDYLLKVRAQGMKQYQEFVLNKLGDIDNISAIESTFVMSEVKQSYGINI